MNLFQQIQSKDQFFSFRCLNVYKANRCSLLTKALKFQKYFQLMHACIQLLEICDRCFGRKVYYNQIARFQTSSIQFYWPPSFFVVTVVIEALTLITNAVVPEKV